MIHYSCDRCNKLIDSEDLRYIVTVEVQATMTPADLEEEDDDRDHLLELEEILERMEDAENDSISEDVYQRRRYDLCPTCYRQYVKNPVGQEKSVSLGFSQN